MDKSNFLQFRRQHQWQKIKDLTALLSERREGDKVYMTTAIDEAVEHYTKYLKRKK